MFATADATGAAPQRGKCPSILNGTTGVKASVCPCTMAILIRNVFCKVFCVIYINIVNHRCCQKRLRS